MFFYKNKGDGIIFFIFALQNPRLNCIISEKEKK